MKKMFVKFFPRFCQIIIIASCSSENSHEEKKVICPADTKSTCNCPWIQPPPEQMCSHDGTEWIPAQCECDEKIRAKYVCTRKEEFDKLCRNNIIIGFVRKDYTMAYEDCTQSPSDCDSTGIFCCHNAP